MIFYQLYLICIVLSFLPAGTTLGSYTTTMSQSISATSPSQYFLQPVRRFPFVDKQVPLQFLLEFRFLPDGSFFAADYLAQVVRHFDKNGAVIGRVASSSTSSRRWIPTAMDIDPTSKYLVINNRSIITRVSLTNPREQVELFRNEFIELHQLRALSHARLVLFGLPFTASNKSYYVHLIDGGRYVKSFHEPGPLALKSMSFCTPSLASDAQDKVFVLDKIDGIVSSYRADSVLDRQWHIAPSQYFRPFSPAPSGTSRDAAAQRDWQRTFTIYSSILYLSQSRRLLIFERNDDPPSRPNQIHLYSIMGDRICSVPAPGFLVGCDGDDNIYLCNQDRFVDSGCTIDVVHLSSRR